MFEVGELVLAKHGHLMIYDAKILKINTSDGLLLHTKDELMEYIENRKKTAKSRHKSMKLNDDIQSWSYYIHYQNWKKNWDEWVPHERLLKDTGPNRTLQKDAKDEFERAKRENKLGSKKRICTSGITNPKKARGLDSPFKHLRVDASLETETSPYLVQDQDVTHNTSDNQDPKCEVPISIPFSLKKQLVDDWRQITHEPHKLVPLPRSPNVYEIITEFLNGKRTLEIYKDILENLESYFDRSATSILLYRMERKQLSDYMQSNPGVPFREIFGAEHFLRLFVRLPILLADANASKSVIVQIQGCLTDLLKFMQKNSTRFFLPKYEIADEAYVKLALIEHT